MIEYMVDERVGFQLETTADDIVIGWWLLTGDVDGWRGSN